MVYCVSDFVRYRVLPGAATNPYRSVSVGISTSDATFFKVCAKDKVDSGVVDVRIKRKHSVRYVTALVFRTSSFDVSYKRSKIFLGDGGVIKVGRIFDTRPHI